MRAPLTQRALAGVVDLGWEISLAWLLLLDPSSAYPGLGRLSVWLLTVAAARTASCAAFSGTFGHLLCGLRLMDSTGERLTGLEAAAAAWGFQRGGFLGRPAGVNSGKIATATASLAALAGVLLNVAAGLTWVRAQPLLLRGIAWQVPVFQAAADPLYQRSWAVLPFFYAVGPWPKRYMGDPVFYTLPYSKGPPKQFPSKVLVRWDSGETRLAIEGPHTPSGGIDEHKLKSCIVDGGYTPACASLKQRVLGDDVARMRSLHASRWTIRWFEVPNTALPENERPHGVYLMGSNGKMVQERYVLITPSGALQALALDHTDDPMGNRSGAELETTIGGLRLAPDLTTGRSLAAEALSQVKLDDLKQLHDSFSFVARLAEIQAMLIGQISVEPDNINAYYHLGGLSLMLLQHAADMRTQRTQLVPQEVLLMLDQWTAAARPMIQAAYKYAQDVAPDHANTTRLQNLWIAAQKL